MGLMPRRAHGCVEYASDGVIVFSVNTNTQENGERPQFTGKKSLMFLFRTGTTDMTQSEPYPLVLERTFQALCTLATSVIVITCVSPWVWGEPMRPKMQYGRCSPTEDPEHPLATVAQLVGHISQTYLFLLGREEEDSVGGVHR